jgi:alkylresorcinol/alkylpyrone synthase
MEDYRALDSFSKMNDKWIERASDLGQEAVESALSQAGLEPADIDHIFFTTVTGIASPSIDAKLINRMSIRPDIKTDSYFRARMRRWSCRTRTSGRLSARFRSTRRCWCR